MKHSPIDATINQARRTSMETADRVRNTTRQFEKSNTPNSVVQQNGVGIHGQEMTLDSDSAKNIQTGSAGTSNMKLPGTSVRQMQQRSRSMTSESREPMATAVSNRVPDISDNGEPEIKNQAMKRSHSVTGLSSNKENTRLVLKCKPVVTVGNGQQSTSANEPGHKTAYHWGLQPGLTQTGLYNHRRWLEA